MTLGERCCVMLRGLAFSALLLAGCGGDANTGNAVVLKHSKLFGDPAAFTALLREFEARNPGLRVREETLPSSSDEQHQFYAVNLQARSAAFDVLAVDVIWVAEFAAAGWLRDVSHLLPDAERTSFFSGPVQAVSYEGRAYAVPWFIDAGLLYYRKDLLDKHGVSAPRTWPELVRAVQAVTAREPGLQGFVWQGKQYEGLVCNALEYIWSNAGDVLVSPRPVIDSAQSRAALAFMADLIHRYGVSPTSVTTATEEPSRQVFGQGRALFLRNWPYAWSLFQADGSPVKDKVGVSVLPHFEGGESAATLGGWQLAVNRYSTRADAAEKLVQFLTSSEAQKRLALAYAFQPTRTALYRDAELMAAQPFLNRLEQVFAAARPRPVTPHYVRLSQVLQAEFSAAISGMKPAAEALATAQRRLEEIMARGG